MKKSLTLAVFIIIVSNAFSQVAQFGIEKSGKSKVLDPDAYVEFVIDIAGDSLDYGSITYSGQIESLNREKLSLYPASIEKEGYMDGYSFNFSQQYNDMEGELVQIDPMTISSIYYQSSGASAVSTVSAALTVLGYTTALFVAPLISINYKTGDFNSRRYYRVAGAGLITVGVTLPIAVLTSGKTFELKDLFMNDEFDEGWEFDYDLVETY